MSNSREAEKKINENIDKASNSAQEEVTRLRAELDDLRRRAGPKVKEAESFLCSPAAIGFYQGFVVGIAVVLGYAKVNGGLRL
ncbi:uncharacterized protein BYT42DRAFT_580989 [Radiomyces spectabilis]|uniref:uncharacterized protein n=1 Tax=Radiomyces spectabilis TaxID=64574 RepID=UPI0022200B13|nr:uncharacterized protein BYT42DRAFT_580989 [Radiomyces spectabilis]KAI8371650.1 hypothetical protein BYT42DRAFT_580989 [Radiomyces spectabilis]